MVKYRGTLLQEACFYIATLEIVSLRKEREDRLRQMAMEELLTGLPNRRVVHKQRVEIVSQAYFKECSGYLFINDFGRLKITPKPPAGRLYSLSL